jgi:hypothetical protein
MSDELPAGRELDALVAEHASGPLDGDTMKPCRKCGSERMRTGGTLGRRWCLDCAARRHKRNGLPDGFAEYRRRWQLAHRYGLTAEQFDALATSQGGKCAICRRAPTNRQKGAALHVDHDHTTAMVRGLLCNGCNVGLANFGDDPERLRDAAGYIERARNSALR